MPEGPVTNALRQWQWQWQRPARPTQILFSRTGFGNKYHCLVLSNAIMRGTAAQFLISAGGPLLGGEKVGGGGVVGEGRGKI